MKGLHRAALLYSLVQSAKLAGVEPWAYLKDVLDRLPTHPHSRIGELLPKQWAAPPPTPRPPPPRCPERALPPSPRQPT